MSTHKKAIIFIICFAAVVGCSNPAALSSPPATSSTETLLPQTAAETLLPTQTPLPTQPETPQPTNTLVPPTATPSYTVKSVRFTTEDGIRLAGTIFGDGEPAVILAHQGTPGANQKSWHAFARVLAEHSFTALAFDFRGIGLSEGSHDRDKLDLDLAAALQFLQDQGHEKVFCVGASMGGTTCMRKALDGAIFEGLVTLGSALITDWGIGIKVSEEELASLTIPKLFIAAEEDIDLVVNDTTRMYENSPEPKVIYFLPGSAHGTDLFKTDAADQLTAILLEFLENILGS